MPTTSRNSRDTCRCSVMNKRRGAMLVEAMFAAIIGLASATAVASAVFTAVGEWSVANDNYQLERAREAVIAQLARGGEVTDDLRTNGCVVEKTGSEHGFIKFKLSRSGFKTERFAYVVWPSDE